MEGCDIVGVQFAILTGIRGERVHSGVVDLESAVCCDPQITDLIRAERIDMVVDQGLHTILGQRVDGRGAILDTCETIAL